MKTRQLSALIIASLFTAAGSTAFANDVWQGDVGDNWQQHIQSTKTRAQVLAELNEARAQGFGVGARDTDYPKMQAVKSSRTRDEVRAEAAGAVKNMNRTTDYSSGQ